MVRLLYLVDITSYVGVNYFYYGIDLLTPKNTVIQGFGLITEVLKWSKVHLKNR